jgi:hypothetical protein
MSFFPSPGIGLLFYTLIALVGSIIKINKKDNTKKQQHGRYILLIVLCIDIAIYTTFGLIVLHNYKVINFDVLENIFRISDTVINYFKNFFIDIIQLVTYSLSLNLINY